MALTDADLEGFELSAEVKPEKTSGVSVSTIPAVLVKLLEKAVPKVLDPKDPTDEITLSLPYKAFPQETEKEKVTESRKEVEGNVKQLALYAAAWGKGQEPKLYIHKLPNRKEMSANVARLAVEKWEDVPKENRPGRR